jgi:hypothetical protein
LRARLHRRQPCSHRIAVVARENQKWIGAAPIVVRARTDAAAGEVTMTFLVITITTGRCGVADLVGARVGDASAAGLGDSRGSPTA